MKPATPSSRPNLLDRATGNVTNTVMAVIGLVLTVLPWLKHSSNFQLAAMIAVCLAAGALAFRLIYLSHTGVWLRRPQGAAMSDPDYFSQVHTEIEAQILERSEELADGALRYTAAEIPGAYLLLYRAVLTLTEAERCVFATDLTGNPSLLTTRTEYLAANRRLIASGGAVKRVFICREADLFDQNFFRALNQVVETHSGIGVECGLCVKEQLPAHHAIDFVIFGGGAVIVEEEQADQAYNAGRSTVYFKRVESWRRRFDDMWHENESSSAARRLQRYFAAAQLAISTDNWTDDKISVALQDLS